MPEHAASCKLEEVLPSTLISTQPMPKQGDRKCALVSRRNSTGSPLELMARTRFDPVCTMAYSNCSAACYGASNTSDNTNERKAHFDTIRGFYRVVSGAVCWAYTEVSAKHGKASVERATLRTPYSLPRRCVNFKSEGCALAGPASSAIC